MRLRPTWSERLATPFGMASLRECSSSRGVSIACAASTKTLPVATPSLPSQRLKRMAVTRPSAPTSTDVGRGLRHGATRAVLLRQPTDERSRRISPASGRSGCSSHCRSRPAARRALTELRRLRRGAHLVLRAGQAPAHRPCPGRSAGWPASDSRQSVANRAARRNRPTTPISCSASP